MEGAEGGVKSDFIDATVNLSASFLCKALFWSMLNWGCLYLAPSERPRESRDSCQQSWSVCVCVCALGDGGGERGRVFWGFLVFDSPNIDVYKNGPPIMYLWDAVNLMMT